MTLNIVADIGTSHFRAGLANSKGFVSEPCTVARAPEGKFIIGEEAERMVGRHPENVEVVHPVFGGTIKDYESTVSIFRYMSRQLINQRMPRRFKLTLSVPSVTTQVERRALEEAAREAGASHVELFDALVAAAIGANLPIEQPTGCLLVGMGAGTTEIALLSFGGIVHSRRLNIGGQTVDEEIMDWFRRERGFLIGRHTAQRLKCEVGSGKTEEISVTGRSLQTGLPEKLDVPDTVVKSAFRNYYNAIVELIVETIEACPPELVGDIMDRGIVLVGGGANNANALDGLTQRTEVPVIVANSPETCVIRGLLKAKSTVSNADRTGNNSSDDTESRLSVEKPLRNLQTVWRNRIASRLRKTQD